MGDSCGDKPGAFAYPRFRDGFLRRIASLIPLASCRMMASSPLDEGASTGDGQLTGRGAAPAAATKVAPGMCVPSRAASYGEDDGPNVPGSPEKSAHRHYERLPRGWLKGGAPGRRAKARRPGEVREREVPVSLTAPVPERGIRGRKTPRRAPETAPEKCNLSGPPVTRRAFGCI